MRNWNLPTILSSAFDFSIYLPLSLVFIISLHKTEIIKYRDKYAHQAPTKKQIIFSSWKFNCKKNNSNKMQSQRSKHSGVGQSITASFLPPVGRSCVNRPETCWPASHHPANQLQMECLRTLAIYTSVLTDWVRTRMALGRKGANIQWPCAKRKKRLGKDIQS